MYALEILRTGPDGQGMVRPNSRFSVEYWIRENLRGLLLFYIRSEYARLAQW
jgi:hypothetical protein